MSNTNKNNILEDVVNKISVYNPITIFLYGSRARGDFLDNSDFEIGVIFTKDKYVKRSELQKVISIEGVNVYPFKLEDLKSNNPDTPFQKNIYLRELILTGKTIYGEKILENSTPPSIRVVDILQDIRFNIGYSLGALISHKNKDKETANFLFYKSCLFGTRDLLILKEKHFSLDYDEIVLYSANLSLASEYKSLINTAIDCRKNNSLYKENDIFQNISYLNKFIESELIEYYKKYGNEILVN